MANGGKSSKQASKGSTLRIRAEDRVRFDRICRGESRNGVLQLKCLIDYWCVANDLDIDTAEPRRATKKRAG
jgi:hypothetical protein